LTITRIRMVGSIVGEAGKAPVFAP